MDMPEIDFAFNWNGKLWCRFFTTIRLMSAKYKVGDRYAIHYKKRHIGPGLIREITPFKLAQLTAKMAMLDTGYELESCRDLMRTMYKNIVSDPDTAQFAFILIEMPEKRLFDLPEEVYGTYAESEKVKAESEATV